MATIASVQSGGWSTPATWAGGTVPGNGDIAEIGHAITVDVNAAIGTSPEAGTDAVTFTAAVTLTIAAGVQLTVCGDMTMIHASNLQMDAGSILEFDASQAGSPSTTHYELHLGTISWAQTHLVANGTAVNKCHVRSNASGGNASIALYPTRLAHGQIQATHVNFSNLGSSSQPSVGTLDPQNNSANRIYFDDCNFDNCGEVRLYTTVDGDYLRFQRTTFTNSLATNNIYCSFAGNLATGERLIDNCVFDAVLRLVPPTDLTITNCIIYEDPVYNSAGTWALFSGNLLRKSGSSTSNVYGDMTDCFLLQAWAGSNSHGWAMRGEWPVTFDGLAIQALGTGNAADMIQPINPSAARTYTIKNCILLPSVDDEWVGSFLSATSCGANSTLVIEHNTYVTGGSGTAETGVKVGEGYAGHAGMIGSLKSNIAFYKTPNNGYKLQRMATSTVQDIVAAADADYNCGHNLATGELKGYNAATTPPTLWSSGTGGANDIDVNPGFVDATRNLATWDDSLGGTGTTANAVAELLKLNDSDWNSNYSVANLLAYVRGGFAPTNSALDGTAHDGGDIGAVAYQAGSTPPNLLPIGDSSIIG